MAEEIPASAQAQFYDPYNDIMSGINTGKTNLTWGEKFIDTFTGGKIAKHATQNKISQENTINRANVQSARAWEEYFDSTAVQRRVKDIEKAGLNPWLALQSGGINSNGSSSTGVGSSAKIPSNADKELDLLKLLTSAFMIRKLLG